MRTCKYLTLCAIVFFENAWGMPATASVGTPSYGAEIQSDFSKKLAQVMNNMHKGGNDLMAPGINLGMNVLPAIFQQGMRTATGSINKIGAAGTEGFQKMGVGAAQAMGGGGVLGSAIAGGAMQVAGHGLGVGVDVADAGARAGIDFLGRVGDNAASGISVGTTIGGTTLSTLGNGMIAAGTGVNVLSNGLSKLLDAIGLRLSSGINATEQAIAGLMDAGVLKLENGALTLSATAQAQVYNVLNSFMQILLNVQKLFDSLRVGVNAGVTVPGVTGTANVGTGSAAQSAAKFVRDLTEPLAGRVESTLPQATPKDIEITTQKM